ncbi:MAG TPA: glycosyltransferase family 39 protein [Candidatus Polarisedimenticolaceae bacterium]|nr:glycosyltransferase family 39 protein [Candidatus Polarisedimenticolaceae bacterium]
MRGGARRAGLLVMLAAAALLFFPWLGAHDLWNPNEPIYGQAVREMAARGDWLVPTVSGQVFAEKPVLYYWLALSASRAAGGVSEATLRLPSAAAALILVVLVWALVGPYAGLRRAAVAGLLLCTTYMVWWGARTAQMDVLVAASTAGALLPLVRSADFGLKPWKGWALAGLVCGGGFLAKGPIAVVFPGIAFAAYLTATGRLLGARSLLAPGPMLACAAAFLAVIAPWILALAARGQLAMLQETFLRQNLTRFVAAWDHRQPFWYYGLHVWIGNAPWSPLLPVAVRLPGRTEGERRLDTLAWCWLLGGIAFLSLSQSKRNDYLLPAAAAVAILVSGPLMRWMDGGALPRWRRTWTVGLLAVLALAALGLAAALVIVPPRRAPVLEVTGRVAAAVLAAGAAALAAMLVRSRRRGAAIAAWGMFAAFYLVAAAALLPAADAFKSARPFCRAMARHVAPGDRVASYRFWRWRAEYTFYGDRAIESLQTPEELRAWRGRFVLVEDWALPEVRRVLGDGPVALTGRVGGGTIVLLGPLH